MADGLSVEAFTVDVDGFAGPLDLLLTLARQQKVDLARISMVALADQYLAYLERARSLRLEIAAEYLVIAAWLAYLKSQLLLPPAARDEPDAQEQADALMERLRLLEALRQAAGELAARPRLGVERLARGCPEPPEVERVNVYGASLSSLFAAYGAVLQRTRMPSFRVLPRQAMSVETALSHLCRALTGHDWRDLASFLPPGLTDDFARRSALAASLVASLELARAGRIELSQAAPFAPVMVRSRS
jgi:segregation and condensation protein A